MPRNGVPRVGIPFLEPSGLPDAVQDAGGEPVPLRLPSARPAGGVALMREWISDATEVFCAPEDLDALLLDSDDPAEMAGLLAAALRLELPVVVATPPKTPFSVSLVALGLSPPSGDPAEVAVEVGRSGEPGARDLVESFSLANALRAGLSLGGGPELMMHLVALAREAEVAGFSRMARVMAPENPALTGPGSEWFGEHGAGGLLAHLGEELHDLPTVAGQLKEALPPAPAGPPEDGGSRIVFARGRASGTEVVCRVSGETSEVSGECLFFDSERRAVRALERGAVGPGSLVVVAGCGPRGGPGLLRLERLARMLESPGFEGIPVLTDGLAPDGAGGDWLSLFTPEAAEEGIIGRLRDGDSLRIDLEERRIRTHAKPDEIEQREPLGSSVPAGHGYAARYAASALPALEGAGFGW